MKSNLLLLMGAILFLLSLLTQYDFIAVYKTKYMRKIAKEMSETSAILDFLKI